MEGPRGLHLDELDVCLDLVNRVFRTRGGHALSMRQEFPLLFAPENVGRLRVMVDGDRVVCHIGVLYQTILVGDCALPVACVGAVCTDPAYRGRGLATKALLDVMEMMRRDGRVLLLISGSRSLYTLRGCVPVGRRLVFAAPAADLAPLADPDLTVRPRRDGDLAAMRRIYDAEGVRYERTDETLRALLAAAEGYGTATVMVERGAEGVVGYFVIRHGGPMAWWGPGVGRVLEYAGSHEALVGALEAVAELVGATELSIPVLAGHHVMVERLAAAGLTPKEDTLGGLALVMDAAGLLARLGPWWRGRLGEEVAGSIAAIEGDAGVTGLAVAGGVIPTAGAAGLTRLLFSAERPAAVEGDEAEDPFRSLSTALPVPLPDYGLNYV